MALFDKKSEGSTLLRGDAEMLRKLWRLLGHRTRAEKDPDLDSAKARYLDVIARTDATIEMILREQDQEKPNASLDNS